MEWGHLLHSALTCPPGGNPQHLKSRHPFVPTTQQLISSSDDNNRSAALWADINDGTRSGWRTLQDSVLSYPTLAPTHLERSCQEQCGSGLTASTPVSDVSAPVYSNGVRYLLWLVWRRGTTVDHVVLNTFGTTTREYSCLHSNSHNFFRTFTMKISTNFLHTCAHHPLKFEVNLTKTFGVTCIRVVAMVPRSLQKFILFSKV